MQAELDMNARYQLIVGERYRYGFPGCPAGYATYMGTVEPIGYLAFQSDDEEITFLNPARISSLKPESYPR